MTPDKLRAVAKILDLMDVILDRVEFRMGEEVIDITKVKGQDMQADLRRWADEMEQPCQSCHGSGTLRTSSWDEEGFPCPDCNGSR